MRQIIILVLLGLLTIAGAVTEMFVHDLPQQLVQINGLLTILFAMAFVIFSLRLQVRGFQKQE